MIALADPYSRFKRVIFPCHLLGVLNGARMTLLTSMCVGIREGAVYPRFSIFIAAAAAKQVTSHMTKKLIANHQNIKQMEGHP